LFPSTERLGRWVSSRYVGPLAVTLAVLVLAVSEIGYQGVQNIGEDREVMLEARAAAGKVRRLILMMESAKRGYMLSGRDEYLQPYTDMARQIDPTIEQLQRAAAASPSQHDTLLQIIDVVQAKRSEMTEVLDRFGRGDRQGAMELMLTDIGREHMVMLNRLVDEVLVEEGMAYDDAGRLADRVLVWSRIGIWVLVLSCLGAVFAALRLGRDRERERAVHLLQLSAERDKLEEQVDRRTAELEDLARHMQRVREDERGRLARELHDELGGLLTAAKLDVARVKKRVPEPADEILERIRHLSETLDAGIALKRRIIEDLRPSSLSNLGLQRTLEIQCAEFSKRSDIPVEAEVEDLKLDPERALAVYRLVQEALTNIAKYAGATRVRVVLQRLGDRAQVRVEDNGRGFDAASLPVGGHGLAGMRFRMRSCGGELMLDSAPGRGTTVEARLPL
jgi:signal transduction histidine kinase